MRIKSNPAKYSEIWCRRRDSNSRPRDYETLALPLSYAGRNEPVHGKKQVGEVSRTAEYPFLRDPPPARLLAICEL
jgi:hypothetical protein